VTLPTYGKRSRPIKKKVKTTKGTRKYDTEKNAYRNYETVMAHKFLNVCGILPKTAGECFFRAWKRVISEKSCWGVRLVEQVY